MRGKLTVEAYGKSVTFDFDADNNIYDLIEEVITPALICMGYGDVSIARGMDNKAYDIRDGIKTSYKILMEEQENE
jgi:hypothetical protein